VSYSRNRTRRSSWCTWPVLVLSCTMLAGCSGCRDSEDVDEQDALQTATIQSDDQLQDELFDTAVDSLHRLEKFDSGKMPAMIKQRLVKLQELPDDWKGDRLMVTWPQSEMLGQVVSRLSRWGATQEPTGDWAPDPMLETLPEPLANLPQLRDLDRLEFSPYDGFALREAMWLRAASNWARGDQQDDLQRAKNLFDWTVRNIQLDADRPGRVPLVPWESLFHGRGTAVERAWVFVLLARQQGIDAALLAIEEPDGKEAFEAAVEEAVAESKPTVEEPGFGEEDEEEAVEEEPAEEEPVDEETAEEQAAKEESADADETEEATTEGDTAEDPVVEEEAVEEETDAEPYLRPWTVGVIIGGQVYLFDPLLGLPIPGPDGVKFDAEGNLQIEPATLAEVAADEKLLRRLDVEGVRPYRYNVDADDLKRVVALVEASPANLARRMEMVETRLAGKHKMVLSASPKAQAERFAALPGIARAELWLRPFEVLDSRLHLDKRDMHRQLVRMLPFYAGVDGQNESPLRTGRMLHLKGQLAGERGATYFYQQSRPPDPDLSEEERRNPAVMTMLNDILMPSKRDASYWLGLIAFERENYSSAADYFYNYTLLWWPGSARTSGAQYNLARAQERAGEHTKAAIMYKSDPDSPSYHGNLLRARWLEEKPPEENVEGKAEE